LESLLTQIAVIYILRTEKVPFVKSNPSVPVNASLATILLFGLILVLVPKLDGAKFASLALNQPI
jgi:Mg2+-importing ATPase